MYQITIIGPNISACTPALYQLGERLGQTLAAQPYPLVLVSGGMGGMMEAVFKGVHQHRIQNTITTVGILPFGDKERANPFCDVVLPTGMGVARNALVVQAADVVLALGGGAGTLSELALAWQYQKPVLCYTGLGGWSERLADMDLDNRHRGLLKGVSSLDELLIELNHARNQLDDTPRIT